jgi:hypothetical protein
LPGDPIAEARPVADDLAGQLATLALYFDLPYQYRRLPEAWPMVKAAAIGETRRHREREAAR